MLSRDKYFEKIKMGMERVVRDAILDKVVGKASLRGDIGIETQVTKVIMMTNNSVLKILNQ